MQFSLNKVTRRVVCLLALMLVGIACEAKPLEVKSGYAHPLREWLNVHEGPVPWLSVGGRKYLYVKGDEPYFIAMPIPGRNVIFFITSNQRESEFVYHFVSLDNGQDTAVKVPDTDLWIGLGVGPSRGEVSFETVDWPRIVILRKRKPGPWWDAGWWRYSFDLEKLTVVDTRGATSEPTH